MIFCQKKLLFTALLCCSSTVSIEGWVSSSSLKNQIIRNSATATTKQATTLFSSTEESINNNIVLSPSYDNPDAFDSGKIGNARVHRYSKENDPESEIEYVMWYHGRSKDFESNEELPPLSTGRIGRATSRNGLHWVKDTVGSASEDIDGVTIGLNKDSWWGFDTAHAGLGSVLLPMSTPAVLTEGGVYMMYYMGGSYEETPIKQYLENAPESLDEEAQIKGMKMKIGIALSQDGTSFGRVEGDDPSGACMVPYDSSDPNFVKINGNDKIEEELYCGWPEVIVDMEKTDDSFIMYYSTMTKNDKQKCIGYATSNEGFRWTKQGICIKPDENGLDAGGCARCMVIKDATFDAETKTWKEVDTWTMYYEGISKEDGKHRIMYAISEDGGMNWEKKGLALDVGATDEAWDCAGVGAPHIIRMDDGTQRMYYTGQGKDGSTAIGAAKLEADDQVMEWKREQTTVTFATS